MSKMGSNNVSLTFCAVIGLLVGLLVTGLLMVLGDWRFLSAAFVGAIFFALAFLLLPWWFMKTDPSSVPYGAPVTGNEAGSAPSAADSAAKVAAPAPVEPAPTVPASSGATASADTSAASAGSAAAASATASAAPAAAASAAGASSAVKPSAPLPGEADLASKKGDWKYEGDAKAEPKAAAEPKAKAAEPAAAVEGPGEKPATLDAAREGGPDDLKQIKGVGPKMETMLHGMGFYHFDQVAAWTASEVAWVDQNLEGFKGRVSRDNWVEQAKILAEGGTTEFSKKVDKGGVY